ncbi:hypothetical protein ACX8XP_16765 [Calditrichota bacterium LG25]
MARKILTVALGLIFLFIVSAGDLAHNHSPLQKGNDSCPAYVLSHSIHFEPVFCAVFSTFAAAPLGTLSLKAQILPAEIFFHSFSRRAPPSVLSL